MAAIHCKVLGKKYGNFRPSVHSREDFAKLIEGSLDAFLPKSIQIIYAPKADFTNKIVYFREDVEFWSNKFARTIDSADGAICHGNKTAIAFFNGDCPILCLRQHNFLAVMHAGYRCLLRAKGTEDGIVENAMRHFHPKDTKATIFGGIGPCCWVPEYDDKPEILNPQLCKYPSTLLKCLAKTTSSCPFGQNHTSVDLYQLTRRLLLMARVPEENIQIDGQCTCCAIENGEPAFWSHTRFMAGKQNPDGRNLAVAWID